MILKDDQPNLKTMKQILFSAAFFVLLNYGYATTFHIGVVGSGHPYTQIKTAAAAASPGDTILLHGGTYDNQNVGEEIDNLHGLPNAWYHILGAPGEIVILTGGWNEALKFSEASYIHVSGLRMMNSGWGNMMNVDDGGTYNTPTHNIIIENCIFKDILGQGNSDVLKLTGVDTFTVRNCRFYNGAWDENQGGDGAGIDMNGCHQGVIEDTYFEYPGRFAMQTKAGCHAIIIRRNFIQGRPYKPIACERSVQIGGSHGGIFRPANANYNAADIWVYSNIFSGGWAPIAFVGTVNSHVINNTFFMPENWIMRILQEQTVSDAGIPMLPCANNSFRNNIIYLGNMSPYGEFQVNYTNTNPGSFTFSNNLWYKINAPNWTGPSNSPVVDLNNIVNLDPLFVDTLTYAFDLMAGSPAIGKGVAIPQVMNDYHNLPFNGTRSVGAIEFNTTTAIFHPATYPGQMTVYQDIHTQELTIELSCVAKTTAQIVISDIQGKTLRNIFSGPVSSGENNFSTETKSFSPGIYFVSAKTGSGTISKKIVITR